jgi:multiple sugar transport system substrate-binding protein
MAWGNPEQLNLERRLCDIFNGQNPDVHISLIQVPGSAYLNKLTVMLATDTAPDVVRCDHYNFPSLVEKGYFTDLAPYAKADPDFHTSDFWPQTVEEETYQGDLYGLNVLFGGVLVYYNQTMAKQAGIEDPYTAWKRGAWTWDMFRADAKAMTRYDAGQEPVQFGFLLTTSISYLAPVCWAFGGDVLSPDHKRCTFDSPGSVAGLQFLTDMRWIDHSCPTPSEGSNSAFTFESGKVGMALDTMGDAPHYRAVVSAFQWDVVPFPRGPASGSGFDKGNQIVIPSCSKHKAEAWRFIKFITSPATEKLLYVDLRRCFPTRIAIAESPEYLHPSTPPFHMDAFLDAVKNGRPLPIDDRWEEWGRAASSELDDLWSGQDRDAARVARRASLAATKVLVEGAGW